jgi:hypothetical protein
MAAIVRSRVQPSQARVATTAGTLQPNPATTCTRSRPARPTRRVNGSSAAPARSSVPRERAAPSNAETTTTVGSAHTSSSGPIVSSP